jgi:hypothetical protein
VEAKAVGNTKVTVSVGDIKKVIDIVVQPETIALTGISVDKESPLALIVGELKTITATPVPGNATGVNFSWSSSPSAVATVSNTGEVEALTAGTATITVASGGIEATVTVVVTLPEIPLAGISVDVDDNALTLIVGAQRQITATPLPGNTTTALNFLWEPANAAIATVTDGLVKAVAEGSTTITVSQGDIKTDIAVTVTALPLAEVTKPYAAVPLASDATASPSYPISALWDNFWAPAYPLQGTTSFPQAAMPQMFTIDIGASTVLKGINVRHNAEYEYSFCPHHFKVYGSNASGTPNDNLNHEDWTLLGEYTFPDPPENFPLPEGWTHYTNSGNHIVNTDIAFASSNGGEFLFEGNTAAFRYVRFQTLSTYASEGDEVRLAWTSQVGYSGTTYVELGEITLLKAAE